MVGKNSCMEYAVLSPMLISQSHELPQRKKGLWVVGREEGVCRTRSRMFCITLNYYFRPLVFSLGSLGPPRKNPIEMNGLHLEKKPPYL